MNLKNQNVVIGLAIIVIGLLILLSNINFLHMDDDFVGGAVLVVMAFLFYNVYTQQKSKKWALFVAIFLACIGVALILENFLFFPGDLVGVFLFWGIAAFFGFLYYNNKDNWWAIIPAGFCFTIGSVVLVDDFRLVSGDLSGVVFFLGGALTFFYLWSQKTAKNNVDWAKYPAFVLAILAVIVYVDSVSWLTEDVVFPAILVVIGLVLILRSSRKK